MSFQLTTKKFAAYSVAAALIAASQGAFAHTGVKDTVDVTSLSGKASYNAFTITHGCAAGEGAEPIPVIGQSAVFPHGDSAVWVKLGATPTPITAQEVIGAPSINLAVAGLQDSSVFAVQNEEADELGVVHAINWKKGKLDPTLYGLTTFRVSVPKIVDKCVSRLRIRMAVANWCKKSNEADDAENNRADWWFTAETGTTKFTDPEIIQPSYWTTLTANNLEFDAASCGEGYEVAVMPSGADIDKYLPHPAFTVRPGPF